MKKTMSSKLAGFLIISMMSMTVGVIPALAAVTTSLYPNGQGTYTAWDGTESDIDETGAPDCSTMEGVYTGNTNDRESVVIDLSSVPNGSTITSVDIVVAYRDSILSGDNGTFKTFTRFNGINLDATSNLVASSGTCSSSTQTLNVVDTVKNGATTLEVGVLKTATDNSTVFVGAIHAIITYTSANTAPVANAKSITLNEDASLSSNVVAVDSDVPAQTLTYSIVANPSHGAISGFNSGTGAFTYTPSTNYNGVDSFTFKANDGTVDSNTATVSITVNSVNDIPVATAASYSTDEDTAKSITLAATDVDVPAQTLTYGISDTSAAHGTVSLSGNTVTYTPALNYNGPASFKFTAKDGIASSTQATISLTVTSVNDTPVTVGDSVATHMNTAKTITLGATDVDVPAQTLTRSVVSGPSNGTLGTVGSTVVYTPTENYVGSDSFTFKVNDGSADSNVSTINIAVNDDAPVLGAIGDKTGNELVALTFTASATDPNEGDTLVYSLVGAPVGATIDSGTGAFSWTPAEDQGPAEYAFSVNVTDGAITDSETITVTVSEVNSAPVPVSLTGEDKVSATEDTVKDITLSANDSDVPTQTLTYALGALPTHGTVTIEGVTVTYTPNLNYYGNDSFTFTVTDGVVEPVTGTVDIYVNPVNDAPVVTLKGAGYLLYTVAFPWVDEGATATDIEDGDITASIVRTGDLDMNTVGEYTLTYTATDSGKNTNGGEEGNGSCPEENESCLKGTATRIVGIVPRSGGLSDTQVGCTDPKATNYNPSASYSNSFTCTYGPKGEVLGASTGPTGETPKAPETPTLPTPPAGMVLGASTSCKESGLYLTKFAREGYKNDVDTVKKLQEFLNKQLGLNIPVTGYFGPMTTAALKKFQLLHKDVMLTPWNLTKPTGILYLTTLAGINNLICSELPSSVSSKDLIPFNQHPDAPKR